MTHLPPAVSAITQRPIGLLDEALLGQLEAFHLVGSVAQGDYRDGQSDVDLVAVLAQPVDLAALAAAHANLAHAFRGSTATVSICDQANCRRDGANENIMGLF